MSAKLTSFFSRYWIYLYSTASVIGVIATWLSGVEGAGVRNVALLNCLIVIPLLAVVYGRQHGQGMAVIAVRAYVAIARCPRPLSPRLSDFQAGPTRCSRRACATS